MTPLPLSEWREEDVFGLYTTESSVEGAGRVRSVVDYLCRPDLLFFYRSENERPTHFTKIEIPEEPR